MQGTAQAKQQQGMGLVMVLIVGALMVMVVLSSLRSSWIQERIQANAGFQQLTFQAAESGLDWWLYHAEQRIRGEGIAALQQDGWFDQAIQACATLNGLVIAPCQTLPDARFHPGMVPVWVDLVTRFVGQKRAPHSSSDNAIYYYFETEANGYIESSGVRRFVSRHQQQWRWLDKSLTL